MRYFTRLLTELQELAKNHRPGERLAPPALLDSITVQGKRLSYLRMGVNNRGPAVILLHGFGGFFMDWPRVMGPISRSHRVFAPDLPGWGFSEARPSSGGIEDDVAVVSELIRHHGLDEVLLAGISYGAAVAWASACLRLPQLRKVVLLNPMPPYPIQYLRSPLYRAIFAANRFPLAARLGGLLMSKEHYKLICKENLLHYRLIDSLYLDLGYLVLKQPDIHLNVHLHASKARTMDWSAWERRFGGIRVPVTIMQGREDRVFNLESARYLQCLIPGAKLIEVEDCGHAMVFDQHRRVTSYILESLAPAPARETG